MDICNDIFTSHNVFLDIQNDIVMHFGYLKWKLRLVTTELKISEMGVFPSKNSIADIQNVHSRYPECNFLSNLGGLCQAGTT